MAFSFTVIVLVVIVIAGILSFLYGKKIKKNKIRKLITYWIILGVALGLFYSVTFYYSVGAESGIVICNEDECSIAMHIHADIDVEVCGEKVNFPWEEGDLGGMHTHKERNLMHWHDITSIDPETNELLNPEEISIRAFLEQMEFEFPKDCNGDEAELNVLVNGLENLDKLDYSWKDKDEIIIKFE